MTYENFTLVAQNALKTASQIAKERKHLFIENGHILKGMVASDKNVAPFILRKIGIDIESFEKQINTIVENYPQQKDGDKLNVSAHVDRSLNKALELSKQLKDEFVSIEHILAGILITGDSVAALMKEKGINQNILFEAIKELRKGVEVEKQTHEKAEYLAKFAINLNEKVKAGKIDPVIGRSDEIRRILQIISRRTKNNPMVVGEPGVGKTAVIEGIAHRIVRGDVPENLKNVEILSLDIAGLIAGASKQGEFEDRLKQVIKEVQQAAGEIILFIDEIHLLVGAGKGAGAMDAANILKPALARGELKLIGATTLNEYQKYIEQDKALERRFQKVVIDQPTVEDAISILRGLKEKYESHHKVRIKDEAIVAAVELSYRYITDRFLPDKAIDLLDEAASKLRMELNSLPEELDEIERKITQLQIEKEAIKKEGDEVKVKTISDKIAELSDERTKFRAARELQKNIIADIHKNRALLEDTNKQIEQAEKDANYEKASELKYKTLKEIQTEIEKLNAELQKNQTEVVLSKEAVDKELIAEMVSETTGIPVNKMTQSEKDKLVNLEEVLSKRIIGQKEAIAAVANAIRTSRAGMQDENKPIGSFIFLGTTGVGKTELAKALSEFLFDNEKSMTRIDMSEYQEQHSVSKLIGAPPGYAGFDEGGQLTEAVRRRPYSVILLDEIEKAHKDVFNILLQVLDDGRLTDGKGRTVNFKNTIIVLTSNAGAEKITANFSKLTVENRAEILQKTKDEVSQALKEKMSPEFLNRLDEIIMFTPLTYSEITKIVELQLNNLTMRLAKTNIHIYTTRIAKQWIAKVSYNPQFGARPVKRTIQRHIINELSKKLLSDEIQKDKIVLLDLKENKLDFKFISSEELEKIKKDEVAQALQKIEEPKPVVVEPEKPKDENVGFFGKIWNWVKGIF